jgi:hypothetical protein
MECSSKKGKYKQPETLRNRSGSKIFTKFFTFKDIDLEQNFIDSRAAYQRFFFRLLCPIYGTLSIVTYLSNPFQVELYAYIHILPFLGTLTFLALAYFIVIAKLPKSAEKGLAMTALFYGIFVGEALRLKINNIDNRLEPRWITDVMLQITGIFLIVSRVRWIYCGTILLALQLYITLRLWNDFSSFQKIIPRVVELLIYGILYPLLKFFRELEDRKFFFRVEQKKATLKAFNFLIKDVLPTSLILIDGEKIQYFNNRINEMLGVNNENELIHIMKEIEVITIHNI